ncbi:disulfide-isomerase [Raphidocelis subcapitata]|uniref:Disulfide-isomerase n=1 Tax=Raphidocelis subcapitata TaxID=307507 RepID=A0A2V0NNK8_9CHLO|nr:disulfide-isomerase [Raphidocelis subcapitata]|eukprot:GBF88082.1 disulfide-isomerase [Raphidocelis subcapitata]
MAPLGRSLSRLRAVDFYKKVPLELTEATLTGAWLSMAAAVLMATLLVLEFAAYLRVQTVSELVVDRSHSNELVKVTFNISFPALSCEFATLDVSDALGTKRMNLTKTVTRVPIDLDLSKAGVAVEEPQPEGGPKYDAEGAWWDNVDITVPLTSDNFKTTLARHPIVVVNFYAPWCHWCQRLEPAWEAATKAVHEKYPEGADGRIRFAKVDCTAEMELCRGHFITGFPSIRVFRRGHDDIYIEGMHQHEAYQGDRTKEALEAFADSLVPSAGLPHHQHGQLVAAPQVHGCNMAGFVLVKKVPGTLHFTARAEGHSFDHGAMNMSHVVHAFHFGARPSPRKLWELKKLHPGGLTSDWLDKMAGQLFRSDSPQHTHEHWLQVVTTTIEPRRATRGSSYDAYEYTANSHTYVSDSTPSAKFSYALSPIQVIVREKPRRFYHFVTTLCAIIGGVFTVAGILDAILHNAVKVLRKHELGKYT